MIHANLPFQIVQAPSKQSPHSSGQASLGSSFFTKKTFTPFCCPSAVNACHRRKKLHFVKNFLTKIPHAISPLLLFPKRLSPFGSPICTLFVLLERFDMGVVSQIKNLDNAPSFSPQSIRFAGTPFLTPPGTLHPFRVQA